MAMCAIMEGDEIIAKYTIPQPGETYTDSIGTIGTYSPLDKDEISKLCPPCYSIFFPSVASAMPTTQKDRDARCPHCLFFLEFLPSNDLSQVSSIQVPTRYILHGPYYPPSSYPPTTVYEDDEDDEDDEDGEDDLSEDENDVDEIDADLVDEDLFDNGEIDEDETDEDEIKVRA
ncbi:hypothetical protein MMC12_007570 [Toensbergia leucococca]|nr:hypothetical protein [Toensbergia leucococca]